MHSTHFQIITGYLRLEIYLVKLKRNTNGLEQMLRRGNIEELVAALLSDPTADTADSTVQADLSRLHPRPSKPVTPVPHLEQPSSTHAVSPYPMLLEL